MSQETQVPTTHLDSNAQFPTTHWSVIVAVGGPTSMLARDSLNQLCQVYWHPVYAFLRRQGTDSHKAKDLTQSFFVRMLGKEFHKLADPAKGRFRSFLLDDFEKFRVDEWRKEAAQKRGGGAPPVSIDEAEAEGRYGVLPVQEPDPVKIFDRAWAATVIEQAKRELRESCAQRDRLKVYEALAPFLARESDPEQFSALAAGLNMTRDNLQVGTSRLRKEFGVCLREVIGRTVNDPAEIDDEIRHLLAAWAARTETSSQ